MFLSSHKRELSRMCRLRFIFKRSSLFLFILIQQSHRRDSGIKQLHNVCVKDESENQEHTITLYQLPKCVLKNWNESGGWPFNSRKKKKTEERERKGLIGKKQAEMFETSDNASDIINTYFNNRALSPSSGHSGLWHTAVYSSSGEQRTWSVSA